MLFGFLTTILSGVVVVAVIVGILALINREAVAKLWFNLRSSVGSGARAVDANNAVNNMKQAVEDAKAQVSEYTKKLNKSQGQIDGLKRNAAEAKSEVARLTARVQERAAEVNGNEDDEILLSLAGQLSTAQEKEADLTKELTTQTGLHNQVLEQVKATVARAAELEADADRLGVKLDLAATRSELASVGIDFKKSSAHGSLAAAEQYKKDIQKQIDENNAAVTVAGQLNPDAGSAAARDWEKKQDAKAVLRNLGITKKPEA